MMRRNEMFLSTGDEKRVLVFGGSGTAGQSVVRQLLLAGHQVSCVLRSSKRAVDGARVIVADVTQPMQISNSFDVVVSCLASRTGTKKDAWAIDHAAQMNVLAVAKAVGAEHFILLSAICVQKPRLPFQHAKLAFEEALIASGIEYSIVRPTAFFKSLSGQLDRIRAGKPFLVFGDGRLTACKPISDADLGTYITSCIHDPSRRNKVLPIGGPGRAITPMDQADALFQLLERPVNVRRIPVGLIKTIEKTLSVFGYFNAGIADKAALARIGHYYATESMLLWDDETERYDADATPAAGSETLFDYYAELIAEDKTVNRGDHSVF